MHHLSIQKLLMMLECQHKEVQFLWEDIQALSILVP